MPTYRILLPLRKEDPHADLVSLAGHLFPAEGGQIELMGVVEVAERSSLSEAAVPVQEMRAALIAVAEEFPDLPVRVKPCVRVAHVPWLEVLSELQDEPVDLLLATWDRTEKTVLGAVPEEVLARAPCDLILCQDMVHRYDRVLVPIRGGPHIALTLRLAHALSLLTGEEVILLSVKSKSGAPRALNRLQKQLPFRSRVIAAEGDPAKVITNMAADYHALVLGATLPEMEQEGPVGGTLSELLNVVPLPVFLVNSFRPASKRIPAVAPPSATLRQPLTLSERVDRWFATNTYRWTEFMDVQQLLRWKGKQGQTISLVLPALNEEATIGNIISAIKTALVDEYPLLDEIVVVDSGSTDRTQDIASSLGVPVYIHQDILSGEVGSYHGKGEALWKSLYVAKGDIIVWIDTDITNIHPRFVLGVVGPLLRWERIQYVKGFYHRPLRTKSETLAGGGGGRVTELLARPLINLFYPELSGIVQPLSGEYAGRRRALEQLPFFSGYGVETGLLLDFLRHFGLYAIAQCDLEMRTHVSQALPDLSRMSFAILQVFAARLAAGENVSLLPDVRRTMKIIHREPGRFCLEEEEITEHERPPMTAVPAYQTKFPQKRAITRS